MDGQFIFKTEKVVVCQHCKVQTRIPVPPQQFILVLASANETCLHSASASSTGMLLFSYWISVCACICRLLLQCK